MFSCRRPLLTGLQEDLLSTTVYEHILKEEFANSLIDIFEVYKYDIIWTENGDVIDIFIPEIITFEECSKRVQHVLDKL